MKIFFRLEKLISNLVNVFAMFKVSKTIRSQKSNKMHDDLDLLFIIIIFLASSINSTGMHATRLEFKMLQICHQDTVSLV